MLFGLIKAADAAWTTLSQLAVKEIWNLSKCSPGFMCLNFDFLNILFTILDSFIFMQI